MRQMRLVAIQPRCFKPRTTDSRHSLGYSPNLLIDAPPPDDINGQWVGAAIAAGSMPAASIAACLHGHGCGKA